MFLAMRIVCGLLISWLTVSASGYAQGSIDLDVLIPFTAVADTGEKPQSKVWRHDGTWWAVMPDADGAAVWRLEGEAWTNSLMLSKLTTCFADVVTHGDIVHVLLYAGANTKLATIKYDAGTRAYSMWSERRDPVAIPLEQGGEMATIDLDGSGRLWLASDAPDAIHVRWSDAPYMHWSKPIVLAEGVDDDDICAVTSLPDGGVGVLWSNQNTKRFGYRVHEKDAEPDVWTVDEKPAAASAIDWEGGMADDHLNLAVASDGTLYAAVKTSYDTRGYPLIALLVRRPDGVWDPLYSVDDEGSRGIVVLDETRRRLAVVYSSYRDNLIVCRVSDAKEIAFGPRVTLLGDGEKRINNATSAKQNVDGEFVVLAAIETTIHGARLRF